ncbi:hypothetical protein HYX07_01885 [Candidatus Woesearchaeota archaeon]|nr:hypothetical protein [Candidatus Woesearchaeota archaeon]
MYKNMVMLCPKCGSTNVYSDLSKDMMAWGASTRWLCKYCDYSSVVFPEIKKSEIKKFRKNIKLRTKEQEEIINEPTVTKGFTNKRFNFILLSLYLGGIVSSLVLLITYSITNKNYVIFIFILLLILAIGFGTLLNKLIKN